MTLATLTPHGQPTVQKTVGVGWTRLASDIGVYGERGLAPVQVRTARGGWYTLKVVFDDGTVWGPHSGYLPPRCILTIRPDSPPPTLGLLRPSGDPSDFSAGGGQGIDACGTPGTVHDHDSLTQRNAMGLYDMATGKLLAASAIPVEGYFRGTSGWPWNKVVQFPPYSRKWDPANPYDDRRNAADATTIPNEGLAMREAVLKWCRFDYQHLVRYLRFALLLLDDPFVRADLRSQHRECEKAWDAAREQEILSSAPRKGHGGIGREAAWVGYLAAIVERMDGLKGKANALLGLGLAARMRRILKHVQHPTSGAFQRFVEGMSASPYPYGPSPNSGVPVGKGIALMQHLEACALIVATYALGMKRECALLCETLLPAPGLKWWNTDTGKPEGGGWHGPAEDQVWPAIGVWLRVNRRPALEACKKHKVPDKSGAWNGPYSTIPEVVTALKYGEPGKNRWAIQELEAS